MTDSSPPQDPTHDDDGDPLVCKPGEVFAGYRVEGYLACGGMSQIYAVIHEVMQREGALKAMKAHRRENLNSAHRSASEAMALAAGEHENVVRILHTDHDPRIGLFIVMERLRGRNMRTVMERLALRGARLSIPEAAAIVLDVASAVSVFHDKGIINRDLKPENIFIHERREGVRVVKLLDFGVAKLPPGKAKTTDKKLTIGTLQYMPREQLLEGIVSRQSDIYSLALVFDEFISGAHPFSPGAAVPDPSVRLSVIRSNIIRGAYEPLSLRVPGVSAELSDFIASCLSLDVSKRPRSMPEFAEGLRRIVRSMVHVARARSSGEVEVGQGEVIARSVEDVAVQPVARSVAPPVARAAAAGSATARGSVSVNAAEPMRAAAPIGPSARPAPAPKPQLPPFAAANDARLAWPSLLLINAPGVWRFTRIPLRFPRDLGMYARGGVTIGGGSSDIPVPGVKQFMIIETREGELMLSSPGTKVRGIRLGDPIPDYAVFTVEGYEMMLVPPTPHGLGFPPDYDALTVARDARLDVPSLLVKAGHKWVKDRRFPITKPVVRIGGAPDDDLPLFRFPVGHAILLRAAGGAEGDAYTVERSSDGFSLNLSGARATEGLITPTAKLRMDDWELTLLTADRRRG